MFPTRRLHGETFRLSSSSLPSSTRNRNPVIFSGVLSMSSAIATEVRSSTNHRHQTPKTACDECRRRKLRCDGKKPQCGVCVDTGVVCATTQRGVRGPKKGHLRALKSHIVQLEAMLQDRSSAFQDEPEGTAANYADGGSTSCGATGTAFVSMGPVAQNLPLSSLLHGEL